MNAPLKRLFYYNACLLVAKKKTTDARATTIAKHAFGDVILVSSRANAAKVATLTLDLADILSTRKPRGLA